MLFSFIRMMPFCPWSISTLATTTAKPHYPVQSKQTKYPVPVKSIIGLTLVQYEYSTIRPIHTYTNEAKKNWWYQGG